MVKEIQSPEKTSHGLNIAQKLLKVMEATSYIQKDKENKEQHYKYVSAAAVFDKITEALIQNKLISKPEYDLVESKEKQTAKGGVWQLITVSCDLTIIDTESGEILVTRAYGTGVDPNDKAIAKAQTMALKYAWMTCLNISTGDDPEADPETDKQNFVSIPPEVELSTRVMNIWLSKGWTDQQLHQWIFQRFNRSIQQLSLPELEVIKNELETYPK
ncbi:ERF family protein [Dehalobacter sp.]|uniref:ERF family protein n=1 Tax=Dehalobacter sp. TaxID=1962289 RepID=UPI00258E94F7|nr:ERF family protein [Dehalobacter sp.]MDJ0305370.1 ERF family protein [Dehalobacter sp.]